MSEKATILTTRWPKRTLFGIILLVLTPTLFAVYMEYRPMPWDKMDVVLPSGETPELVFSALRMAASDRAWKKFYGCLTSDARCEQLTTLTYDVGFLANRAKSVRDGLTDRFAITSPEETMKRCKNCLEVLERYGIDTAKISLKVAPSVDNLNQFVIDAWDAMEDPGFLKIEEKASLSGLRIDGDNAIAEVHGNYNRHQNTNQDYIRFKKVNGRWLIDMAPWWFPWGPSFRESPLTKKRNIPFRSRRWTVGAYEGFRLLPMCVC